MTDRYSKEDLEHIENIESGKYVSVKNLDSLKEEYAKYAINTSEANKNISIAISERDLASLQMRAMEEGLPYQTFISSLLHKYINGRLVDVGVERKRI